MSRPLAIAHPRSAAAANFDQRNMTTGVMQIAGTCGLAA
jgi:hypothetical protein